MKKILMLNVALGAAATGALLGILYAPYKGKSTRKKIAKKSHEYSDMVIDSYGRLMHTVTHPLEKKRKMKFFLVKKAFAKG